MRELRAQVATAGVYDDSGGHRGLREAIARHVGVSRGVQVSPGDVTITNGAQQALDLIARALLSPRDRVAVEDPGYAPLARLFHLKWLFLCATSVSSVSLWLIICRNN